MIGLVVVSHNRKLAEEIINFSNEMKQFDFPVENGGEQAVKYMEQNRR